VHIVKYTTNYVLCMYTVLQAAVSKKCTNTPLVYDTEGVGICNAVP